MKKAFLIVFLAISQLSFAQLIQDPIHWDYSVKRINKTEAIITINAVIDKGWHIYSQTIKEGGPIRTSFEFLPSSQHELIGETTESKPETRYDSNFKMDIGFFQGIATFQQKVKLKKEGPITLKCKLEYSPCNDNICLMPATKELELLLD